MRKNITGRTNGKYIDTLRPYIKIARFDHCIKQLFILPGSVVAIFLCHIIPEYNICMRILWGLLGTTFVASANYVINEYLDAEFDKFHPTKKYRPLVNKNVKFKYIISEYLLLLFCGLFIASTLSENVLFLAALLALMGIIYNVKPLRFKDIAYADVITESFNMAIRLLIGWFLITSEYLPPLSLVLGYWFTGAYLMSVKRFSEYRAINNAELAGKYRKSFQFYTENKLMVQSLFYAIISMFFMGIFLIKYRIELIIDIPLLCFLYCYYFNLSFAKDSSTQKPEKLFKEKALMVLLLFIGILSAMLLFVKIPWLYVFAGSQLISINQ